MWYVLIYSGSVERKRQIDDENQYSPNSQKHKVHKNGSRKDYEISNDLMSSRKTSVEKCGSNKKQDTASK